jgi:hypothetical protein
MEPLLGLVDRDRIREIQGGDTEVRDRMRQRIARYLHTCGLRHRVQPNAARKTSEVRELLIGWTPQGFSRKLLAHGCSTNSHVVDQRYSTSGI